MNTPSRREFFTCAAAATLASALPASAQTKKVQTPRDSTLLPLVVYITGPIACRWSTTLFELWMPDLSSGVAEHEAGIKTPATSFKLLKGTYKIDGPKSNASLCEEPPGKSAIYKHQARNIAAQNGYIYITIPKPRCIVALDPVLAKIYEKESPFPSQPTSYAGGVRLLYDHAGKPTLTKTDSQGSPQDIELGTARCEMQSDILIGHLPLDLKSDHAADSFREVSKLFSLNLEIVTTDMTGDVPTISPFHPCRSPVLGLMP